MSSASGMKCLLTNEGSTWIPVYHRARFPVQAPHVLPSGLPSAAVKMTSGFYFLIVILNTPIYLNKSPVHHLYYLVMAVASYCLTFR